MKTGILLTAAEDEHKQIGIIEFDPTGMLIYHVMLKGLHVFALKTIERYLKENGLEVPLYVKYDNFLKKQHEIPQAILEEEANYYVEILNRLEPPVRIGEQKIKTEVVHY